MAEINWIKLRVDMFDDDKIKIIQSMPEGDAILVVWIRILALAGKCNAKGLVLIEDEFWRLFLISRWQPSAWPLRPSRSST